jgi:hypothetical protein
MTHNVLLKGEVPIQAKELDRLRRRDAELDDYMAAIRSPELAAIRHRALRVMRGDILPAQNTAALNAWAQGVMDYERSLGDALLAELRLRS